MKQDIWTQTQPAELDTQTAEPPRSPLLDAKVMMVDDEPLMTELVQTHLEDAGYTNFAVTNDPRRALAMLRGEQPAVLLLDLMMPQMSGFDLLAAIRADRELRYLPVIVLTASTGADSKLRALQLGATDFLAKPVDASELALRVRNTLAFRHYHERLRHYDAVTGLPNGAPFERTVDAAIARRALVGGCVAVLGIDVPELQQLRESLGQDAADRLAREFAHRLAAFAHQAMPAAAARQGREPHAARLSPDRFGLLLEGLADAGAAEAEVKRLLAAVAAPVTVGALEVVPGPWAGIAMAPTDGQHAAELRKAADVALTRTRQLARLPYGFASAELSARSYERLALGLQLRGAAARGELVLHFQPKVETASGRIVGAEALVRWQHPEHGLLAPGRFIALAEELGLIGEIGQWVLERACVEAAAWGRAGWPIKVAINVSKPQFADGGLVRSIRQAMFDSGLPAQQLVVELTESLLMDDTAAALALMQELKALGVTLSIDDFGTGYSSLGYLKRFPIDELKVDRSFVADLPGRPADTAIVQSIIALGGCLGMTVVAEGVETEAQRACLARLGCHHYQGFLFSPPLPGEHFVERLRRAHGG